MFEVASFFAVTLLALVHVFVGRMRFIDRNLDIWQSAAGGVGSAYAFLILLPKLAAAQTALQAARDTGIYGFLEHHSYLLALGGLVTYYGLEIKVENLRVDGKFHTLSPRTKFMVYCHASGVAGYFMLVAYLITELRDRGAMSLGLFTSAMLLHFVAIDHLILHKYGELYDWLIRWVLVAFTMAGWIIGATTEISYTTLALWNSLFAGALVATVFAEELPGRREGRFLPFLVGAAVYSIIVLVLEFLASH